MRRWRPVPLPSAGVEHSITSDEFLYLEYLPKRIVFIGGRYISMEFAYVASAVGSEVSVLQRASRIMERFDTDMVSILDNGEAIEAELVVGAVGSVPNVDTLLGAHLVGPHAGELINLFALAIFCTDNKEGDHH